MSIYETLYKYQGKTHYLQSEEWRYFSANSAILSTNSAFEPYVKPEISFDVIRANIIIRGLFAKKKIDKAIKEALSLVKKDPSFDVNAYINNAKEGLPYFLSSGIKIYIPFLPKSANRLYDQTPERLLNAPYDNLLDDFEGLICDPFETYHTALYSSRFTRLCPVYHASEGVALYDVDAERLYFVNNQGRLDAMVCYFDKYLLHPSRTRILERSLKVAQAYYENDRLAFIRALNEQRLVSSYLLHKIEKARNK